MKKHPTKTKLSARSTPPPSGGNRPARGSLFLRLTQNVLLLPRLARIALVAGLALVVTVAFMPLVDWIYLSFFFSETTKVIPSLVSTAAGVVMYLAGWVLLVGMVGQPPAPRRATVVYLLVGIVAVLLVVVLVIQGYSIAVEP
jgi:hypothetical protein